MSVCSRTAVLLLVCLATSGGTFAQSCPTSAPTGVQVNLAGCGAVTQPCPVGVPVAFQAIGVTPWYSDGPPHAIESCDQLQWGFGDGTSFTNVTGNGNVTHTFTAAGSRDVSVRLSNSSGTVYGYASIVVANGTIQLQPSTLSVVEGEVARVKVIRSNSSGAFSLAYQTSTFSAIAGTDYQQRSGNVAFADGQTEAFIDVPTIDGTSYRGTRTFGIALAQNPNPYVYSGTATAQITITENDVPATIRLPARTYTVSERDTSVMIAVQRTGDISSTVSVGYNVNGSTTPLPAPTNGTIVFQPNETSKTIALALQLNNPGVTGDRTYTLVLRDPTNFARIEEGSATTTLVVQDAEPLPTITVNNVEVAEGNSGFATAPMTVQLSQPVPAGATLYLAYRRVGGTATEFVDFDGVSTSTTVIALAAGQSSYVLPLRAYGDTAIEANETVQIEIAPYQNCCGSQNPPYRVLTPAVTLTIINDDLGITAPATIRKGDSAEITLQLFPSATPRVIGVSTSTDSLTVPSSVAVPANTGTVRFSVTGVKTGSATITLTLPPGAGPATKSIFIRVHEGIGLVLSSDDIALNAGESRAITVRTSPALTVPLVVSVNSADSSVASASNTTIPAGGTGEIVITAGKPGTTTLTASVPNAYGGMNFFIVATVKGLPKGPTITRVSPPTGGIAGGSAVTLSGLNLRGDCSVTFGGTPAAQLRFVSATELTAITPAHALGNVDVALTCGTETFNFTRGYTYVAAPPQMSRITPNFGSTAGGTSIRITGSDLQSHCGIYFGNAPARHIDLRSSSEMSAVAPPGTSGPVDVTLRCGEDTVVARNAYSFIEGPDPSASIMSVEPLYGAPGEQIMITGTRLRADDRITIGDVAARIVRTTFDTQVVVVPELAAGRASITIRDAAGRVTTTGPIFNVLEAVPPHITSLTPAETNAGGELTAEGRGFRTGYTVAIGEQTASVASISFDRMTLRVPSSLPAGKYSLSFRNASGAVAAFGPNVTIKAGGPAIASVSPACASSEGGTVITLTGNGFGAAPRVEIGGIAARDVIVIDERTLNVTVPANNLGATSIRVIAENGATANLTDAFTYYSPHDGAPPCSGGQRTRSVRR